MLWSDKMLHSLQYGKNFNGQNPRNLTAWGLFSAGPGRQLRLRCHRVWEIQESFVISAFEIMEILFESVCFMDDENILSNISNSFHVSHSREVSSWPLAVCSQCGLGGEVRGLFCIWLKFAWADFWRIVIDAIDVIQGGDRAGQLCLWLRLQSKATNPTFGGRIWLLLQTTQTHYISGELNV